MRGERWWAAAGDLLLGAACPGCAAPWWGPCPGCRAQLRERRPFLALPGNEPDGPPLTVSCSPYDTLAARLVNAHKERGALGLAPLLAEPLALAVAALLRHGGTGAPVLLVPVPSAAAAVRRRGYDATATLAHRAARRLSPRGDVGMARLLRQRSGVRDQAGLTAAERRRNLAGALRVRGALLRLVLAGSGSRAVVLVDDVVTTGSSLAEARRVLAAAGLEVVGAATVAAAQRHPERPAGGPGPSPRGPRHLEATGTRPSLPSAGSTV